MSLKPCEECGTSISSHARICPKCGVKWPFKTAKDRKDEQRLMRVGGCLLLPFVILIAFWVLLYFLASFSD